MTFEEFKNIIDQFPKLKWIGLTGIGQSHLNKDFIKMLEYVKLKGVYVELYDDFNLINERISERLIDLGVERIFTSFDAATKETYEKIRVGGKFERVINNVKKFDKLKKEKEAYFPELCFHYIIMKENLHEVIKYLELLHSLELDVTFVQFTRMLHNFEEVKDLFVEVPEELIAETEEKARELGIKIMWNLDVPQKKPPINKCTAWSMPFIFATGHVIPCCAGNEAKRREFQKATSLGNVFEQSFKDIWYGEKYREFRKKIRKGEVPPPCTDCPLFATK
jgi:MoaA/NifB/PqqE/SkfB family radical SAM enzyme